MVSRNDRKYDFALSFDGTDRLLARNLADTLIEAGYSVFLDEKDRESVISDRIELRIERAFRNSRSFIVFLRTEYNSNKWTLFEEKIIREVYETNKSCRILVVQTIGNEQFSWLPDDVFYLKQTPGIISKILFYVQDDKITLGPKKEKSHNIPKILRSVKIDDDDILFFQSFSNRRAITVTHVFKSGVPKFEINFLEIGSISGASAAMPVLFESHVVTLKPTPGYIYAYRGRIFMNIFPERYTPQSYLFENMPASRMSSIRDNALYGLYLDVTARPVQQIVMAPVLLFVVPDQFLCDPYISVEKIDDQIVRSILRPRVDKIDGSWIVTKELTTREIGLISDLRLRILKRVVD